MREYPTKVDVRKTRKARVVRLPPQLTARTEEALAPAIREALDAPTGFVVVDFSGVRTTDSAGISPRSSLRSATSTRPVCATVSKRSAAFLDASLRTASNAS